MANLNEMLELSAKKTEADESAAPPERPPLILSIILVLVFCVAGLLLVAATWSVCLATIADERSLFLCVRLAVFVVPGAAWALTLGLTKRRDPISRSRILTTSLIGFLVSAAVAYAALLPWAMFAAAFRDVRM